MASPFNNRKHLEPSVPKNLVFERSLKMKNYMLNKVIVPWDFSEMSEEALEATLTMVESPDKVEVVHVAAFPVVMEPGVVWDTVSEDSIVERVHEAFQEYCEKHALPEIAMTTVFGDPGSRIAEIAKEREAGLIVISSHGRTGLGRLLIGSVAERVVRLAHCPVLVLRGGRTGGSDSN